ncbi:hypothetical protein CCACVL1_04748 [Corchorus capsularis]|uniref:Uncharacterized protein n=1 Tax=Corchorus capsularis TaxID=210143 RepID=A0A1R3JPX5_COCAP|nr:hypothetical protein CCACVL1_04748 [Corchorus capsularis]
MVRWEGGEKKALVWEGDENESKPSFLVESKSILGLFEFGWLEIVIAAERGSGAATLERKGSAVKERN